jgi:hypothetical protein
MLHEKIRRLWLECKILECEIAVADVYENIKFPPPTLKSAKESQPRRIKLSGFHKSAGVLFSNTSMAFCRRKAARR